MGWVSEDAVCLPETAGTVQVLDDGVAGVDRDAVVGIKGVEEGAHTQPWGEPVLRLRPEEMGRPTLTF